MSQEDLMRHAVTNAARIGYEYGQLDPHFNFYIVAEELRAGALALAAIESRPDFVWNEDPRTDWESTCAFMAGKLNSPEWVKDWHPVLCEYLELPL